MRRLGGGGPRLASADDILEGQTERDHARRRHRRVRRARRSRARCMDARLTYALERRELIRGHRARRDVRQVREVGPGRAGVRWRCGHGHALLQAYNAMLQGFAVHGHGRAALALFSRMRGEGVTVLAVMCACAHAGLVDEEQLYSEIMEVEFGIAPRIEHFGCMVDMQTNRAGRFDDAEKLIRGMDIPPNAMVYRSLIRACGNHGMMELGERMIGELMRIEPEHGGNYVLPSNFYARMSRWEDAKKARKEMIEGHGH